MSWEIDVCDFCHIEFVTIFLSDSGQSFDISLYLYNIWCEDAMDRVLASYVNGGRGSMFFADTISLTSY